MLQLTWKTFTDHQYTTLVGDYIHTFRVDGFDKLVKIMDYNKSTGQMVLRAFRHVDLGDVFKQKGSFKVTFLSHEVCSVHEKKLNNGKCVKRVRNLA